MLGDELAEDAPIGEDEGVIEVEPTETGLGTAPEDDEEL